MSDSVLTIAFSAAAGAWIALVAWSAWSGARARGAGDPARVMRWADHESRVTMRITVPIAVLALALGLVAARQQVGLDIDRHWWLGTGIGAWIVAFFGSTAPRGMQLRRSTQIAGHAGDPDDEDAQWMVRQSALTARGELLLLVVAALVIALRP